MDKLLRFLLAFLFLLSTGAARAAEPAHIWRVCVTNFYLPPYLYNDPGRLGLLERLVVDAGRQVGLSVLLLRYPIKRCQAMLQTKGLDAVLAAPTPMNLSRYEFPMKAGAVDATKRVGRANLVWVGRPDSPLEWNGRTLVGAPPQRVLVGTRMAQAVATEPLETMGYKVDATSLTIKQLMMKIALKRVDVGLALQEEVEFALQDPELAPLVVQPKAFSTQEFYVVVGQKLDADTHAKVEEWWTAIGKLRDTPDYRIH